MLGIGSYFLERVSSSADVDQQRHDWSRRVEMMLCLSVIGPLPPACNRRRLQYVEEALTRTLGRVRKVGHAICRYFEISISIGRIRRPHNSDYPQHKFGEQMSRLNSSRQAPRDYGTWIAVSLYSGLEHRRLHSLECYHSHRTVLLVTASPT